MEIEDYSYRIYEWIFEHFEIYVFTNPTITHHIVIWYFSPIDPIFTAKKCS